MTGTARRDWKSAAQFHRHAVGDPAPFAHSAARRARGRLQHEVEHRVLLDRAAHRRAAGSACPQPDVAAAVRLAALRHQGFLQVVGVGGVQLAQVRPTLVGLVLLRGG